MWEGQAESFSEVEKFGISGVECQWRRSLVTLWVKVCDGPFADGEVDALESC